MTRHADELETAEDFRQAEVDRGIAALALLSQNEPPEFNALGERVCLDCDVVIPPERVLSVKAVRCVYCQSDFEKERRLGWV